MNPAFKMVLLLRSRDGLDADAFVDAWTALDRSDGIAAEGFVDIAFDAPLAGRVPIEGVQEAPFDAAVETWWERKNDAADWIVSHEFSDEWLPRRMPLLQNRPTAIGGAPRLLWESPSPVPADAVKVLTLPVAARRLRVAEFVDHWTGEHARLALSGPGTRERLLRLEDTPAPTPVTTRLDRALADGIGALTFASIGALEEEFASEHYRRVLAPDEVTFTNPGFSRAVLTRPVAAV
ncbi:EthD domain-containing protein [Microbacterium sp. C7(2022)]|uniref:EthD domain-containing protein n=1 Tax=Microbacterium sp. C7(2022) TaxID=2992759 RepID=UPI00237B4B66|nr:EthD domain-containing protein [Microbacterium sp. C7(2022)]MDE0545987.1 EthD domain-containing protein [Microbacterium sp. C7(2022)]